MNDFGIIGPLWALGGVGGLHHHVGLRLMSV